MKTTIITGVKIILKSTKGKDTGFLKLQITKNATIKTYSLKIKVNKKDFDPVKQRLKSTAEKYKEINEILDEKVNNYQYITPNGKITTVLAFMDTIIKRKNRYSTKDKCEYWKTLLERYILDKYKKEDILFNEIDNEFVINLKTYLKSGQRRINSDNSVNNALRHYKSVLKIAKKENVYLFASNPFDILEFKNQPIDQTSLNLNELKRFIDTDILEFRKSKNLKYDLNEIKSAFIFSALGQGLRISDILTLRWNDFYQNNSETFEGLDIYIKKRMFKTKNFVFIQLDTDMIRFLEGQVCRFGELGAFIGVEGENFYKRIKYIHHKERIEIKERLQKELENFNYDETLEELDERFKKEFYDTDILIANELKPLIILLSQDDRYRNHFVFSFLDNELFKNIDDKNDFGTLNKEQISNLKKDRMYKLFRKMVKQVLGRTDIHFHSARHTWTSLQLEYDTIGMNLNDLKTGLGHLHINSTANYIRNFQNHKIRKMNENLTSKIFENLK